VRVALLLALGLAGCIYNTSRTDRAAADDQHSTPLPEAGVGEARPGDKGQPLDARLDISPAPIVSWTPTTSCNDGNLLGGGFSCGGPLASFFPMQDPPRTLSTNCSGPYSLILASCLLPPSGTTPSVRLVTGQASVPQASCDSTEHVVGGGCLCSAGSAVVASYPKDSLTWQCECSAGLLNAYAVCLTTASTKLTLKLQSGAATAYCPLGQQVIGGGCQTPTGTPLIESIPLHSPEGWSCTAGSAGSTAYAICAN